MVIPIYKPGNKELFNNYRPISLLPLFSKILEKIIHGALVSFLNQNDILHSLQFGFRKLHSTYMPIVHMYNEVTKHLENNEIACSLFLDLKKAFDTVNIKILLKKLQHIGIRGCFFNLRPGGDGVILAPTPLWFFEYNSKTKGSSVTKLGIPFH